MPLSTKGIQMINDGDCLPEIPLDELSSDQSYLYRIITAIRTVVISDERSLDPYPWHDGSPLPAEYVGSMSQPSNQAVNSTLLLILLSATTDLCGSKLSAARSATMVQNTFSKSRHKNKCLRPLGRLLGLSSNETHIGRMKKMCCWLCLQMTMWQIGKQPSTSYSQFAKLLVPLKKSENFSILK
jgi:hypothetical protein